MLGINDFLYPFESNRSPSGGGHPIDVRSSAGFHTRRDTDQPVTR